VRCPACNRSFGVPKPKESTGAAGGVDLASLAQLEAGTEQMEAKELAQVERELASKKAPQTGSDKTLRTCPNCNKQTKVKDQYIEVLCSHCFTPIPPPAVRADNAGRQTSRAGAGVGGFYAELVPSFLYPLPALASLLTAAGIAVLAGLLPVLMISSMKYLMQQSAVGTAEELTQKTNLTVVQLILLGIFALEILFFSAVALHMFLDVIRSTSVGVHRAPNLVWSPTQWGGSIGAFLILTIYYSLALCLLVFLTTGKSMHYFATGGNLGDLLEMGGKWLLVGIVVITFGIPMNLVGMSIGSVFQAVSPARVLKSIAGTIAHYLFMVVLLSTFAIMFGSAFWALIHDWFVPQVEKMSSGSIEGNIVPVALGLLAWAGVMLLYFYGAYVLARLHGVFAKTFRKKLEFGTQ
jgi:hypothetical protein